MARLLLPDGSERVVMPADAQAGFTLEEIYALLSCDMVEAIPVQHGYMLIDEDGKHKKDLAKNPAATTLLAQAGGIPGDYVLGAALVVDFHEFL